MKATIAALLMAAFLAGPVMAQSMQLYDADGNFRGNVNRNQFDPDSISNPFGRYGSRFSPDSINNPFGLGSPFHPGGVNNPYAR